jgi:hypothetical protein
VLYVLIDIYEEMRCLMVRLYIFTCDYQRMYSLQLYTCNKETISPFSTANADAEPHITSTSTIASFPILHVRPDPAIA